MVPPATDIDEAASRAVIDQKLMAAGWVIQDKSRLNLTAGLGVAVREMDTNTGPADYMLFIEGKACGVIEAKREGTHLGGVAEQSQRYATSTVAYVERAAVNDQPLPFLYESTNIEIRFRDERDPSPRSRFIFHFHKPETLKEWLEQGDTLRARLQHFPELNTDNLRACQIDAIHGIERSLTKGKPRALLQMATGSGKTYTAVTQVYRLAKFAKIKRVLFLVDRGNLATNAKDEFEQFVIPNDGRKFTQHYNVNILGRAGIPDATKVTISTIQRMYAQLSGRLIRAKSMTDCYDVTGSSGGQFQQGSEDRVLRNKLGITDPSQMDDVELVLLREMQLKVLGEVETDQSLKVKDLCDWHADWLGTVYEWAGRFRTVNMAKGSFLFAAAQQIPRLMTEFERKFLIAHTPCEDMPEERLIEALGVCHIEFIILHPFCEGNGRLSRVLATVMALQAGMPLLDFSWMAENHEAYINAIHHGHSGNYEPIMQVFCEVLRASKSAV